MLEATQLSCALGTKDRFKQLLCTPVFIVLVALLVRILVLCLAWRRSPPIVEDGFFGSEAGQVAKQIVLGKGFSSPLASDAIFTGPTAYLCPIYPYILAGIFKIWGIYTANSCIAAQSLNCIFSVAAIFPIHAIAKKSFGAWVALFASWLWVFFPAASHIPIAYVWDSTLTALWIALLFWTTQVVCENDRYWAWGCYGALWAVAALTNAGVIGRYMQNGQP